MLNRLKSPGTGLSRKQNGQGSFLHAVTHLYLLDAPLPHICSYLIRIDLSLFLFPFLLPNK